MWFEKVPNRAMAVGVELLLVNGALPRPLRNAESCCLPSSHHCVVVVFTESVKA